MASFATEQHKEQRAEGGGRDNPDSERDHFNMWGSRDGSELKRHGALTGFTRGFARLEIITLVGLTSSLNGRGGEGLEQDGDWFSPNSPPARFTSESVERIEISVCCWDISRPGYGDRSLMSSM